MRKSKRIELSKEAIKFWSLEAKKSNSKFKPYVESILELEKFIIYFNPHDKKIQKNQFHVAAPNMEMAKDILKENINLNCTILGVRNYPAQHEKHFKNLTFH